MPQQSNYDASDLERAFGLLASMAPGSATSSTGGLSGFSLTDGADGTKTLELKLDPRFEQWVDWIGKKHDGDRGFPERQPGDVHGTNGLFRPNYFNGRYLTAETLRKEQAYWDTRSRLVAQTEPAGIAWGLGFRADNWTYPALTQHSSGTAVAPTPPDKRPHPVFDADDQWTRACSLWVAAVRAGDEAQRDLVVASASAGIDQHNGGVGAIQTSVGEFIRWCAFTRDAIAQQRSFLSYCELLHKSDAATRPEILSAVAADLAVTPASGATVNHFLRWCVGLPGSVPPAAVDPFAGGTDLDAPITLDPGLAFDDVGRPVSVGAPFTFRMRDLVNDFRKRPSRLSPGRTQFAPCICVEPVPPGVLPEGQALVPGPYILCIEPEEKEEGEARVYGEICKPADELACQFDGWRGGFGLSLVRYPADVPMDAEGVRSAWDLRGVLSAHFFDVFEHNLSTRWDPSFAADRQFCRGPGPFSRVPGKVALAMVYLGHDGSLVMFDPWIPRRAQVSSASQAWLSNMRGAPTPAASAARLHQFQCQLAESLSVVPHARQPGGGLPPNLLQRGFRHIPPCGFLPVDLSAEALLPNRQDTFGSGAKVAPGTFEKAKFARSFQACSMEGQVAELTCQVAEAYFYGTTVLPYCTIALHDDDILEDLVRSMDKDPVVLRSYDPPSRKEGPLDQLHALLSSSFKQSNLQSKSTGQWLVGGAAGALLQGMLVFALSRMLSRHGVTVDALVNRDMDVVQLIVPLQGKRRRHPILDIIEGDDLSVEFGTATDRLAAFYSQFIDSAKGFRQEYDPRHFVFYVKQRMVFLEVVFCLGELLLLSMKYWARAGDGGKAIGAVSLGKKAATVAENSLNSRAYRDPDARYLSYRALANTSSGEAFAPSGLILSDPMMRDTVVEFARERWKDLASSDVLEAFVTDERTVRERLVAEGLPSEDAEREAFGEAVERGLEEQPGFGFLKWVGLALGPSDAMGIARELVDIAKVRDVEDPAAAAKSKPLGVDVFQPPASIRFGGGSFKGAEIYSVARAAYDSQSLANVVDLEASESKAVDLQLRDVLVRPLGDVESQLGDTKARELRTKLVADGKKLDKAVQALAAAPQAANDEVRAVFEEAFDRQPDDVRKAIAVARRGLSAGDKSFTKPLLDLLPIVGDDGVRAVLNRVWRVSNR